MDIEETTDLYINAQMNIGNKSLANKHTDTHYRLQNGEGSFNYRLLFDIIANPNKNEEMILTLQAKDVDLLSKNDFIGSCALNLSDPIKACMQTG